jgi:UrcA family protein
LNTDAGLTLSFDTHTDLSKCNHQIPELIMRIQSRVSTPTNGLIISIAIALTAIVANTAVAESPNRDFPAVTVKYADLDITTDTGARRLYKRISAAAEQVCPAAGRDLQSLVSAQRCKAEAIEHAVHSIGNSQLAAVHAERVHQS